MRTYLTFLDFALGAAFATIPLTPNYEGTVSYRAIVFPLSQWPSGKGVGFSHAPA